MFDSLKEKIGEFRDDVEETAEEKAAAAEAETEAETEVEAETAGETPAEAGGTVDPGSDSDGDADAPEGEPTVDDGGGAAAVDADADANADIEGDVDADRNTNDASEGAASAGDEDDADTGLGRKVRSLARGKFVIEAEDLEDPLWELEMALLESDVEMSVAEEVLDGIREELVGETRGFRESTGALVEAALREALLDVIGVGQFDFETRVRETDRPVVIVFTGVNGVGKTTTIAKLARYFEERGLSVVLANGDTYRAGANEQIQEHADRLDTRLISHEQGGDPTAVVYDAVEYADANDVDVVLGDTAGRLHTDQGLMDQLAKIHRVVDPDMTVFVDEAVAGQDAVRRAREFDDAAETDGVVLTKADADSQGGAAISIAHVTGKPILFLGTGQEYDDLERFDPERMVDRLLGEAD
ncbi:signal recognition particle-docking protein FtsY [Halobacteriales archaeon SW_5_70_135]|nr:MAG: signal recognition particle-docking protein FtsY [Halobacteriales archaeon SW_5_70_135]